MDKKIAFEYFVNKLYTWYDSQFNSVENNDFSTLKVLKLLFFCSAIEASEDEKSLLDDPFNNFYAMPYGHVESDIYNSIRKKELSYFTIDNTNTVLKNAPNFDGLSNEIKKNIDSSFSKLLEINDHLFLMTPLELVELSHLWYSWRYYYSQAKEGGAFSAKIPNSIIKSEEKILFV
ncbi:type II toxin-antitoxin system antitoxin SocA domain-containing protein [Elizabethkingia ursingii]|uniref:type II toxin-antitoxin system antitoxin SocA domain-containing protein n=1 Tax=Elizabethkingia ursingii TaxID=1756150 RepID=UPI0007507523|nr:type II toxin-antitoxin system antitoxin SocA domain-containing protein [Elizabethkingia ursingii]KUY28525.1 hypothetical protein ATB96_19370 [Elizabethkingia ursingii]